MRFAARFDSPLETGESVAVNGACLTVLEPSAEGFSADVSPETLERTNLGALKAGDPVNLERALTLSQRLGGHLVSGHVDGVGVIRRLERQGDYHLLEVAAPASVTRYCIEKGSIAIDGISLTINEVNGSAIACMIIPHTMEATNLGTRRVGDRVNLEADLIGKYVEKLASPAASTAGLTMEKLLAAGYGPSTD